MQVKGLPSVEKLILDYPVKAASWLWADKWYDTSPISGAVEVEGKEYWAKAINIKDGRQIFAIFDIGTERMEYEKYWNWLYDLFVEGNGLFKNGYRQIKVTSKIGHHMDKFYWGRHKADYKEIHSFSNYPIVGWFCS